MNYFRRGAAAAAIALVSFGAPAANASTVQNVDTVLSLVIDVSGSVSTAEYNLQKTGYVNAFNDANVAAAITNGTLGRIAVNVIQFGTNAVESVAMTIVGNGGITSSAFATILNAITRPESGSTAIGRGIDEAEAKIRAWLAAGNTATRKVIDVSGDGTDNVVGSDPLLDGASFCSTADGGLGGTINGIAIGAGDSLKTFYEDNVACGGGFVLQATTFADFDQAIRTKLRAEISGEDPTDPSVVPLPAGAWLLIGGLGALAAVRRRKAA